MTAERWVELETLQKVCAEWTAGGLPEAGQALDALLGALEVIARNAEDWHGPHTGTGHEQALGVIGRWARDPRSVPPELLTDPRVPGGEISGPGGPYERDGVILDVRRAVVLESVDVALGEAIRRGEPENEEILTMQLGGRIHKTEERVRVLYLTNADGAAGIVTQLIALASRAGWGEEFLTIVEQRMAEIPT